MTAPIICRSVQVYKVFAQLCPAMGLCLGLANGRLPLALEAEVLVDHSEDEPCCAVDVLVATPGRLMSHLQGTPGIHLDALKMLVCQSGMAVLFLPCCIVHPCQVWGHRACSKCFCK